VLEQERECNPFSHSLLYFDLYKKLINKQYLPLPPHQHYRSGLYRSGKNKQMKNSITAMLQCTLAETTVHKGTINLTVIIIIIIITSIIDSRNSRNRKGEQSKQARKEVVE